MRDPIRLRRLQTSLFAVACVFGAAPGSGAAAEPGKYSDEKFDFSLTVPGPWETAKLQNYAVPGVARAAWSGARQASIVAFVQEPGQAFSPRFLVDESAKGIEAGLGAEVPVKEVRTVAGKRAMWLVTEGKGNGGAIDGKGDVLTTQHWVAVPREKDIIVILLTSPSADYEANKKTFEKAVASMAVGGEQTKEQQDAK